MFLVSSAGVAKEGFIFYYDFNDETIGKPPSDPWRPTAVGIIEVVDFPSKANRSVKITDQGNGAGMTLILDNLLKGKTVSLEFEWMQESMAGSGVEIFYVLSQKHPDDWSGVCVKSEAGSFQYNDSGNWVDGDKIENGVWHDIKYVMYLDKNRYDFYWDTKQIAKNVGFRKSEGIEGIDKFNVANVGDGGTTFVMYFDDIMLYEGTVKPLAVEPRSKLTTTWGRIKDSVSQETHGKYPDHRANKFEKGSLSRLKFLR